MKDSPIINEANEPVIITTDVRTAYDEEEAGCGCSSFVPPGARSMFIKFSLAALVIGGGLMYGLWQLLEMVHK